MSGILVISVRLCMHTNIYALTLIRPVGHIVPALFLFRLQLLNAGNPKITDISWNLDDFVDYFDA